MNFLTIRGEDTILDAPAMKRKAHMRAPIVERDHIVAFSHDKQGAAGRADHRAAAGA
jgi:hypothetical protein